MRWSLCAFVAVCMLGITALPVPANASSSIPAARLCDHHRYFDVVKANRHGEAVVLLGHTTKRICGRGGNGYHPAKKTTTVTLRPNTVVRVFTVPGGGGPKLKTIKSAAFPKYLRRANHTGPFPGEDNYRLYGSVKKPSKIVEQFQE